MKSRSDVLRLIVATRNAHKAGEIRAILGDGFRYWTLKNFPNAPTVREDAETFAGNATKKAVHLARWVSATQNSKFKTQNSFVLADDSGLEVDALNGAPGVHSARFAALEQKAGGAHANSADADNNARLLRLLKDVAAEKRSARFRCVLALTPVLPEPVQSSSPVCYADEFEIATERFEGTCEGWIDFAPRGQGGFGYDPLFVPAGFAQSFGELGEATKNQLSHRAKALTRLKQWFDSRRAVSI